MEGLKRWAGRAVRCVLFLALLAVMVLGLDHAMKLRHRDGMSKEYYEFPDGTFDVILAGSSVMMYDVLPMELYSRYGIASYNVATGNQSLGISYYMVKEAVEKDHPSLVILDCSRAAMEEMTSEAGYIHYVTDIMPYYSDNRLSIIRELAEAGDRKGLLFPLIAYHSRWDGMEPVDGNVYTKEGLYGARLMASTHEVVRFETPEYVENAISESGRKYIQKTIELCRETGTRLLMVSLPLPGKNDFFNQEGYNRRWSAAKDLGELARSEGVEYINYIGREEELGIDLNADVFDGEHLNRWGAAKLSGVLGEHIQKEYGLPDHRGEGGIYDQIEADVEKYPVVRMQASLQNASSLRRIAEILAEDAHKKPVSDALVLLALNGRVIQDNFGEKNGQRLLECGLKQNLYEWTGHGYVAVIDGGEVVYESSPEEHGGLNFADSAEGTAGVLQYRVSSGIADEEDGVVRDDASIVVNRLEYAVPERGLYCAVFDKETGELLEACRIKTESTQMSTVHLAP